MVKKVVWFYPFIVIIMQLVPMRYLPPLGMVFIIPGMSKKWRILLLCGFTILGHFLWLAIFQYVSILLPQGPQLKIWGRAGLMGYIILFALWQIVQPCGNRYIQAGNLKEHIRFPLIWRGFREYIWRFVLVFCVLCAAVTVFTYLQTNRTQLILYGLLFAVINSFLEEVLWRGFILARTVDSLGKKQALIVTSLAFGFYHLSLDFSILSCLAFSVGGFYMGGTAIQSKGLFASISMHLAVNMFFVSLGLIF